MPDVFAGVEPDTSEFSDFEALNAFVKSKDPRAKVALSKLTPREMTAYTQWAQTQPEASQTPKGLALASGATLAAGAAPFLPMIPGIGAAAGGALEFGKTVLPYVALGAAGKAMGLNQGTIDAMMIALGLKGAFGKGAAGRVLGGEAAAAEEAMAGRGAKDIVTGRAAAPSAAEMAARGKPSFPSQTPSPYSRAPYGPVEPPMPPNVIRSNPATDRIIRMPRKPGMIGNMGENQIPAPTPTPPNLFRGGPATMGRAPGKPGMIGNPEGGPVTFNEPPKPSSGGKPAGSGRSFTESPSEIASRKALEANGKIPGSSLGKTRGNGTFKEPQKASMPEFPPGHQKGMKPEEFDRLFNDFANKTEDKALLERMRQRIEKGLPKPTEPTKTRRRSPK